MSWPLGGGLENVEGRGGGGKGGGVAREGADSNGADGQSLRISGSRSSM